MRRVFAAGVDVWKMVIQEVTVKIVMSAAIGVVALAFAPSAFASIQISGQVQVGAQSQTITFTSAGSGTYTASSGSLDGISWGPLIASTSGNALSTSFFSVVNGSGSNATAIFSVTESDITGSTYKSMQATGSASATGATSADTIDFNSQVTNSGNTVIGMEDSGALQLNSAMPYTPSSSVAYNAGGVNLNPVSPTIDVTNTWTLDVANGVMANFGGVVTNLQTTSIVTPEPASLALFGLGSVGALVGLRRRVKA